ncbi:hypothetical protein [Amycolatopsis aidingensis]|uniref:hypothetical protein n=1 Tax=Amycolatopsis aidingensis TaxID=2842453 RepID=UPI001C0AABF1|nr:hypothetical protein [Amycolatopsis aidingensis]
MTPTHGSGSPGDRSPEHNQPDPTTPVPLPRTPRTERLRALRLALGHPRPPRPSTVWPCAGDDLHKGTGVIANWLLTAVIKIVTTYTQPGQRVLLLAPSPFGGSPRSHPPATVRTRLQHGPYDGLLEAGWTVVRLGRGIQTQTAGAPPEADTDHPTDHLVNPTVESASGPRPHPDSPDPDDHARPSPTGRPGPDRRPTGQGPDRFALIITAAEPPTLDWLRPTDWANALTPTGALTIITHSDHSRGRLGDPAGPVVTAAHHAGLRYHDRIALLRVPVRNGALADSPVDAGGPSRPPHGPLTAPVRHTQAHDDLLVFTRHEQAPSGAVGGEETSDD